MTLKTLLLSCALGVAAVPATAEPLKLDDYQTVYQRILTKPGAVLRESPETEGGDALRPFVPYYVFAREAEALQIGPSPTAAPDGWIAAADAVEWRQNIVTSFTPASGRQRQLMFAEQAGILEIMRASDPASDLSEKRASAEAGTDVEGVRSVEPEAFVSINDRFYVLPILDFTQELHPVTYEEQLLLKIASVPLSDEADRSGSDQFDAGIVFVLDTTLSMGPFVTAAGRAMESIVAEIRGSELADQVHFGAVAFRDNPAVAPGLDYRVKDVSELNRETPSQTAVQRILGTAFAKVSSPGVEEDSLAGVQYALEETDWDQSGRPFGARYLILLTDAGPKPSGDENAASAITPSVLARAAEEKGVAVLTLHLRNPATPEPQARRAESAYQALSTFGERSYYYAVDADSPDAVGSAANRLARALISSLSEEAAATASIAEEDVSEDERFLGYAMKLRWLGAAEGEQAPSVFEAWVSERAVEAPSRMAFRPRLLITRNELATMAELVEAFIAQGEQIEDSEQAVAFFDDMQETVLRLAQNPERVLNPDAEGVGDALEFLDGLPYRSVILDLDRDRWAQSALERRQVLDNLRPRLVQYKRWLRDDTLWTSLQAADGGALASAGANVYAMPLDLLP